MVRKNDFDPSVALPPGLNIAAIRRARFPLTRALCEVSRFRLRAKENGRRRRMDASARDFA